MKNSSSIRRLGTIAIILTLLAGCDLSSPYRRVEPRIPSDYAASKDHDASSSTAHDSSLADWTRLYRDPRTASLIKLALANNHDLRLASLNVQKVQQQYRIQRSSLFPQIQGSISQVRQRPDSSSDIASYGIGITSYELDLFGRVRNLKEAALSEYFSSVANQRSARISLISAVASADASLRLDETLLRIQREILADQKELTVLTQTRVRETALGSDALHRQLALQADMEANLATLEHQRLQSLSSLLLLIGRTSLPEGLPAPRSTEPVSPVMHLPDVPPGLPSDLLARRPDIISAEHRLRAAHANVGAARAAFFPRISLTGSFGRASTSLSELFDTTSKAWSFIPQISVPIFDGGANEAALAVAITEREMAVTQYEKSIQDAFREVSDALQVHAVLQQVLRARQTQVKEGDKARDLATLQWKAGSISTFEHLTTRQSSLEAKQALARVQWQRELNQITLYKTLGGGWTPSATPGR